MIIKEIEQYLRYCKKNKLKENDYQSLVAYFYSKEGEKNNANKY